MVFGNPHEIPEAEKWGRLFILREQVSLRILDPPMEGFEPIWKGYTGPQNSQFSGSNDPIRDGGFHNNREKIRR